MVTLQLEHCPTWPVSPVGGRTRHYIKVPTLLGPAIHVLCGVLSKTGKWRHLCPLSLLLPALPSGGCSLPPLDYILSTDF